MSQGTLYIHPRSPRSKWLGLFAKALKLDIETVDSLHNKDFEDSFPLKKAPAFKDSTGFELTEVIAIIEYFVSISEDQYLKGKTDKDIAQVLRWLSFINQDFCGVLVDIAFIQTTEEGKAASVLKLTKLVKYINDQLKGKTYLAVDYLTVADVYLFAFFDTLNAFVKVTDESYPNLAKWYASVKADNEIIKKIFP